MYFSSNTSKSPNFDCFRQILILTNTLDQIQKWFRSLFKAKKAT